MWLALKRAVGVVGSRKSRLVPNLRRTLPGAKQGCPAHFVHVLSAAEKIRMYTIITDEPLRVYTEAPLPPRVHSREEAADVRYGSVDDKTRVIEVRSCGIETVDHHAR